MTIQLAGAALVAFSRWTPDRVLLGKRVKEEGKGLWVLPGGKIEANESPMSAVIREAKEEVGLTIVDPTPAGFNWLPDIGEHGCLMLYYLTHVDEDAPKVVATHEFSELRWFPMYQLPAEMWESDRLAISMAIQTREA